MLVISINLSPIQGFLAKKATEELSKQLKTKVTIDHVRIDFLNHLLIRGVYVEDHHHDTLLYAGELSLRITDWFIFKKETPVIHYVGLKDVYAHLYRQRKSDEWNYQFIIDAFASDKPANKKQESVEISLERIALEKVRFHMDDAWVGLDEDIDIGDCNIVAKNIDLKQKKIALDKILVAQFSFYYNDYVGGRPANFPHKQKTMDTTAFNPDLWQVSIQKFDIKDSKFKYDATERPAPIGEFDPLHIDVTKINILATNLRVVGDTLFGKLQHFNAKERSGFLVKNMKADISVSPVASICKNLVLETNNSKLEHYYAMHYSRFPDFENYIHKVVMSGNLSGSSIDFKDLAFFGPAIKNLPEVVKISGEFNGTVDSLAGKNLYITNGITSVKGRMCMVGLPDVYTTFMRFEEGEIFFTNNELFKYAPELSKNPNVAFDKLNYVLFKGNANGYLENFTATGMLQTNLGELQTDISLDIPNFKNKTASYKGKLITQEFDLGTLLRQSTIGNIGFNANVSGTSFDPANAAMQLNASLSHFEVNGYRYQNINAEGTLERKKFDGKLLVDDKNLALAFYGNLDYSSENLNINATANLLKSDLKQLKFTKDSVALTADFDLNFVGNSIDNFDGYAKLYNINLSRANRRIDVDSVNVNSHHEGAKKILEVESNDFAATIKGDFQLSSLPYSFQYYIAGYLPNYIKSPTHYAPNQDLIFHVVTRQVDSLWPVIFPMLKGFNKSSIDGNLNMNKQSLALTAQIPFGAVDNVSFKGVELNGLGNFTKLKVNANINNVVVGNNVLSASMNVLTELGNDSLEFDIATNSPEVVGTASVKGRAHASGDTLYMNLLPSEFYLNKVRWEVPSGNSFAFSKNYLLLRDVLLKSGIQKVEAFSENETTDQSLVINAQNLDVATLGNVAGIAAYDPRGKINGQVRLDKMFTDLQVGYDLHASEFMFEKDTLGNVNLVGNYQTGKKIISLSPQSGIYNGNSSIRTVGSISLDSTNNQPLNGYIQFNEVPLKWTSSFVQDVISKLRGTANGTINIAGSALKPDVSGTLTLNNVSARVDVIGTTYKIPSAKVSVSNTKIGLNNILVYDSYNNVATITGAIKHDRFTDFNLAINASSEKFETVNLKDFENNYFYGNLISNIEQLSLTGPIDNISMNVVGSPVSKSHIYIPIKTDADVSSYSYVSFKTHDQIQVVQKHSRTKFSLSLTAKTNPLAALTLVLDPTTGDEINAIGSGTIDLKMPADGDIKVNGKYEIDEGNYVFTLQQLFFHRNFTINSGSTIDFRGDMSNVEMDIKGLYTTKARLYDLLDVNEKNALSSGSTEERDEAKKMQPVNILLDMKGSLEEPKLSFKVDLAEKRSETNLAYQKLKRINQSDRELFDQVASLLLINTFIPPEGWGGSSAKAGAISNVSEIFSSTASTQLTNIVNKLIGDPDLQIYVKYKSYNLSDQSISVNGINRNEISFGGEKSFFNERLTIQLDNYYDWGKPTSSNSSTRNLNLAGNFLAYWKLTEDGSIRLKAFRTNSYDVLLDRNIGRGGGGITYRRSFNSFYEFLHSSQKKDDSISSTAQEKNKEQKGENKVTE